MTWLSRICFSLLFLSDLSAATVTGRVKLEGSREESVRKKQDYSGVVVWLVPFQARPSATGPRVAVSTMTQKNKTFVPHILAVERGAAVDFPNYDPIFHNAFSNYDGKMFDVGLYPPGSSRRVMFDRAGISRVFCSIHSAMSAVIVVVPTPWFATTNVEGAFEIRDVEPGEYLLRVFHERATEEQLSSLDRRLQVTQGQLDLKTITISEKGFLQVGHKNKYGGEYGPDGENAHIYPASRQ